MTMVATRPKTKAVVSPAFDVRRVRKDFPILAQQANGHPLVYLDNGATTQKPQVVIDAIERYYEQSNANIHRGVYQLSREATTAFETARETVAKFLNAPDVHECIFTRGTTEAINLVAASWGRTFLKAGDEIVLSAMEHHSNIVPWQLVAQATGAVIKVIPMFDAGELCMEGYARLLGPRTKIVAVTHVSNALGTVNDIKRMAAMAHDAGALFLADGAQWVAHFPTDVQDLGVDFYAFSGHKLYGPTGIGVLWGRRELLEQMPPYQGGGDMIENVSFAKTTYAPLPNKFEAGTPHIAGAVGLQAAIEYLLGVGFENFMPHEEELLRYATERLMEVPGLRLIGTAPNKSGVFSFTMQTPPIASLDVGGYLDLEGIAVRTGHHCCQPLMDRLHVPGTVRISLALYNTREDIDACVAALKRLQARRQAEAPSAAKTLERAELAMRSEPKYPEPTAATPELAAQKLIDAFEFLGDWQTRYEYLIDLGKKLLPVPAAERTEVNRVRGCQSTVFLSARKRPGTADVMDFLAESDADIVRGLIAVLQKVYSGHHAREIVEFNVQDFFGRLGIDQNLAMTRRNGLAEMVKRIRTLANAVAQTTANCSKPDCNQCTDGPQESRCS